MAAEKKKPAQTKKPTQTKLSSFVVASSSKKKVDADDFAPDDVDMDDAADEEYDEEEKENDDPDAEPAPKGKGKAKAKPAAKPKPKAKAKPKGKKGEDDDGDQVATGRNYVPPEESNLPPLSDLVEIFTDMVARNDTLSKGAVREIIKNLGGRKLRVATMCSGTESPLFALDKFRTAIHDLFGLEFEIDHVFSCEIVPFKQAYIERNFRPKLLFRDICELGNEYAHTAYGSLAKVPGNIDLLITGTSCVDYSNLNTEKKDIDAGGESGRTFNGLLDFLKNHGARAVILENVSNAPWDEVVVRFEKYGYSANYRRLDTKQFYIPHTRQRGYLCAIKDKSSSIPDQWRDMMGDMQRPASVTLDAWLLTDDDPRIQRERQKLVQESYYSEARRTARVDWTRCESRHQRARADEKLGFKRPFTNWGEGRFTKLPDFAWQDWGRVQVERVWDLLEILMLRAAVLGFDPAYKSQVWNLSQNVDRNTGSSKVGISPCLTPSMIPYLTNRGGPMTGREALNMQGMPVDEMLLTRESSDQEADLAGNAMSTTVVGAAILSCLALGKDFFAHGYIEEVEEMEDAMQTVEDASPVASHIGGFEQLHEQPLDLASAVATPMPVLLAAAARSVRLCACEGRTDVTAVPVQRCGDCDTTTCAACGGRPEHNYQIIDVQAHPRERPSGFARQLKEALPMALGFNVLDAGLLECMRSTLNVPIADGDWAPWRDAVLAALKSELRFIELKRQARWAAVYESGTARLELTLHTTRPTWLFFAKPAASLPANAQVRKTLELPVARFRCDGALLAGQWEIALPVAHEVKITIEGVGEQVPSWEARLGLEDDKFREKTVWSQLRVSVGAADAQHFDRTIAGIYTLFDKCGTASAALHRRETEDGDSPDEEPLYFFLDPRRSSQPEEDPFVFAESHRRYGYGESRPIAAKLHPSWRQSNVQGAQTVVCTIPQVYIAAPDVTVSPLVKDSATVAAPQTEFTISAAEDACATASALLVVQAPLGQSVTGKDWGVDDFHELSPIEERASFRRLAWLTERVKVVHDEFGTWHDSLGAHDAAACERCAPTAPSLTWHKDGNKVKPSENSTQAGEYERRLKARPAPFVTQLKRDGDTGIVRLGINFTSLMHRAAARLPRRHDAPKTRLSWRLDTDFKPLGTLPPYKFTLLSNKLDKEHGRPPNFGKFDLRKEQKRSLGWMLAQESPNAPDFVEEEVSEAILEPLAWRAEGRAQRAVKVLGGVLADEVGYGKTAIMLALIDWTLKTLIEEAKTAPKVEGKIRTKATLILVPPHLTKQWASEIGKFIDKGAKYKVVCIENAGQLNKTSIDGIMNADIVVVASTLFNSQAYLDGLEALGGGARLPNAAGRFFDASLDTVLKGLEAQVERLQTEGSAAVMEAVHAGRKAADEAEKATLAPSKRLRGIQKAADADDAAPAMTAKAKRVAAAKAKAKAADARSSSPPSPVAGAKRQRQQVYVEPVNALAFPDGFSPPPSAPSSLAPTPAPSDTEGEVDDAPSSDRPARPQRRASAKTRMVLDSDSEGEEATTVKKRRLTKAGAAKATRSSSPDFLPSDDDDAEDDKLSDDDLPPSDEDDFAESDEEEEKPAKGKGKAKPKAAAKGKPATKPKAAAKPKAKGKKAAQASSDAEDVDMDDDDEDKPKAKGKGKKPSPKPKVSRALKDFWKLQSAAVKGDWTQMLAPPLEMFLWGRVVVDEYTYLNDKVLSLILRLSKERVWVLSGTSPTKNFTALKTISQFLGVHLGIDDDGENKKTVAKRQAEFTAAEKFHSFREVHTLDWHAHRNLTGQAFLAQFVRQNVAEIDEIKWEEHYITVTLPAAERAIYLELEHHLIAQDMVMKKTHKNESDREKRLNKALGESKSAEEALLKRCSHFEIDTKKENAVRACDYIVDERTSQLEECKADIVKSYKDGFAKELEVGSALADDKTFFREAVRNSLSNDQVGDAEAQAILLELHELSDIGIRAPRGKSGKKMSDEDRASLAWKLREHSYVVNRLVKELVGRVRSLRYFSMVRDLQKQREVAPVVACAGCGRDEVPLDEIAILSSCGHSGCFTCIRKCAADEECIYAKDENVKCKAQARVLNIVKGETLGVDEQRDGEGRRYGAKLEQVIELLKDTTRVKKTDRVLIFVQFQDLMQKVYGVLEAHGIGFLVIQGSATQKSKALDKFQNDSKERVLLLNVMDESASGANLTGANHAIFLSPLLTEAQEEYDACTTQAVGRVRRYGQHKTVHIWRFLTMDTIDVELYEKRTGLKVADVAASASRVTEVVDSDVEME